MTHTVSSCAQSEHCSAVTLPPAPFMAMGIKGERGGWLCQQEAVVTVRIQGQPPAVCRLQPPKSPTHEPGSRSQETWPRAHKNRGCAGGQGFRDRGSGMTDYQAASSDRVGSMQEERKQPLQAAIHSLLATAAGSGTIHTDCEHYDRHRCAYCSASSVRTRPIDARTGGGLLTDLRTLDRTRALRNMSGATKALDGITYNYFPLHSCTAQRCPARCNPRG